MKNLNFYLPFSCNMKLNLDYLLERTWQELSLLRIYTKKPGRAPDFSDPIILRGGASVEHVCHSIHRSIVAVFKYALVWVSSSVLVTVGIMLMKKLAYSRTLGCLGE